MSDETPRAKLPPPSDQEILMAQVSSLENGSPIVPGVNVRQYVGADKKPIYAFLLKETSTGPIVVSPMYMSLSEDGSELEFMPLVTNPVVKLGRGAFLLETIPTGIPLLLYLEAAKMQYSRCPGFFDANTIALLEAFSAVVKLALKHAPLVPTALDVSLSERVTSLEAQAKQSPANPMDVFSEEEPDMDEIFGALPTPRIKKYRTH